MRSHHTDTTQLDFAVGKNCSDSLRLSPTAHRRRDSTRQLSRFGVGCVHWVYLTSRVELRVFVHLLGRPYDSTGGIIFCSYTFYVMFLILLLQVLLHWRIGPANGQRFLTLTNVNLFHRTVAAFEYTFADQSLYNTLYAFYILFIYFLLYCLHNSRLFFSMNACV